MIQPRTITERLLFATLRIEADLSEGATSFGTAFLFNFKIDDEHYMPTIVTNKHVVQGATTGKFKVHLANREVSSYSPSDQSEYLAFDQFEQRFFMHPDPDVDLCAMPFQPLLETARVQDKTIFHVAFDETLVPTQEQLDDLSTVENILMIGYPSGLWDEINNLPLFRRGITASHPAVDHNNKSITMIDAACFPGSSGSPVILYDNGPYTAKTGDMIIGTRIMLLGVLYAGPRFSAQGTITVQEIPTTQVPVALTPVMMHLGYIVKSKEIIVLGNTMINAFR